ncbi:hypothetical protein EVAR_59155_1 [Eumeta japonica]|uniref:Integrase catalytic domain-containing protein n=1 Tax=Eumeta variegata TaxID=151549 RepID=A0A4C1YSM6_EUMVA|nr:hypothetical protein EVAR_59155_1 [Eumeta japonica]
MFRKRNDTHTKRQSGHKKKPSTKVDFKNIENSVSRLKERIKTATDVSFTLNRPAVLSDNGTNFFNANKELMNIQVVHEKMKKEADIRIISWKFIFPGAPNMGGAWEYLVRSVKSTLAAILPFTEVNIEPTEVEGLTTNLFLIGRSCGTADVNRFDDNMLLGPANWQMCQRLADHLWQRWLREYLRIPLSRRTGGDPTCRVPVVGTGCAKNAKCMAILPQLKYMQLICASGCTIYKLQQDWCIRRSCTPTATYEARL